MPGKDQRDMQQQGSKSQGDAKSRDGRKVGKPGKGGKVSKDGSTHHDHLNGDESFDAALDRGDPNYDLDSEAAEEKTHEEILEEVEVELGEGDARSRLRILCVPAADWQIKCLKSNSQDNDFTGNRPWGCAQLVQ